MRNYLLLFLSPFFILSCKEDTTPSWLEIPAFNFTTDEVTEGADSEGITDAWVYMDGAAIGVFELPCRIPILAEGEHYFIINAGIKQNGISAYRMKYPFYERWEGTINLTKGETVSITPNIQYKSNLDFHLIEDFESPGMMFEDDPLTQTSLVFLSETEKPEVVQYGFRCGAVYLNETDSVFKALTSSFLELPKNEDVFLEIDFMNNNSMVMGVIAQNTADYIEHTPYVQMNPQDSASMQWKKIYIDLKEDVSFEINATSYEIYLLSVLDTDNSKGVIYLDNIKIISYK